MRPSNGPARQIALALALLALLSALVGATATRARQGGDLAQSGRLTYLPLVNNGQAQTIPPATVSAELTIRPVPRSQVQRGNDLSVEYRYRNLGNGAATASFSLFYPQRLINFEWLDASGDRYIRHDATRVVIEVRNVAPGETRTGRINFLVLSSAATGSRIGLFAEFECRLTVNCQSNFAEVEVIANSNEGGGGGTFTMSVSPDRGPPGTAHTFSGAFFRPNEPYVTWLNTPTGVMPLPISGRADSSGRIRFTFGSGQLTQAGFYSMVAHGQQSNVDNVGPFIVQINGQPNAVGALAPAPAQTASAAAAPAQAPAQIAGQGGIAGRISDGAGAGLVGVNVEVRSATGDLVAVARSRTNGVYLVPSGLATGQYTVTAKPGIDPAFALFAPATAAPVSVSEPALTADVNLTLPAAGGLAGSVTAGGSPIAGVRVSALSGGGEVAAADVTGATGAYSITNLPAGSYSLRFDPATAPRAAIYPPYTLAGQSVTAGEIGAVPPLELSTTPAAGTATEGLISGRVTDAGTGAGIEDVLVVITKDTPAEGEIFVHVAHTAADGSYISEPLEPSDYKLQFVTLFSEVVTTTRYSGEFYNDAPTFAEADAVSVAVGASATADAGLSLGGSLSGTLSGDGAGPLAEVPVVALDGDSMPRGITLTDTAGAYTFSGLRPGSYAVEFLPSLSLNATARAFYDAAYDTTPATPEPTTVAVGAGAAVTGIDSTLARGAQIVGTVSASDTGEPLNQVVVVFFEAATGGSFTLAGLGLSDASGAYSSPALAPGSYRVLYSTAFSPDATTHTYRSEYFSNRATLAEADAVLVGKLLGSVTRNVDLAPGGRVSGRVSAEDTGASLAGVFVVARTGGPSGPIVGGAVTDEAGAYTLEGLPAATITLSYETAFSPDPVTRDYVGATTTADVAAGETTAVDIALGLEL